MTMHSRPRKLSPIVLLALGLCLLPTAALAQVLGEIRGVVRAEDGSPVPGASVSVRNTETGAQRTAFSDEGGLFAVKSLVSGPYLVTSTLEGMKPATREVTLLVGQNLTVDLGMGMESTAEEITVVDTTPLVETGRSTAASY